MAILLTGGSGAQTAVRIAKLATDAGIPFLYASRRGGDSTEPPSVRFDWEDETTFAAPFEHVFPNGDTIKAVYIILPPVLEPEKPVNAFIDYAAARGVKRFVIMAGTSAKLGGPGAGQIWQHLVDKGVEWAMCKPTWFLENFSENLHGHSIRTEGKFYTCVGTAKVPFVSSIDVGGVAFAALTQPEAPNTDYVIVGPELLSHDELAAKISAAAGRPVQHESLTQQQRTEQMASIGVPPQFAGILASLEAFAGTGSEEGLLNDTVEKLTGQKPVSVDAWIEQNKAAWA